MFCEKFKLGIGLLYCIERRRGCACSFSSSSCKCRTLKVLWSRQGEWNVSLNGAMWVGIRLGTGVLNEEKQGLRLRVQQLKAATAVLCKAGGEAWSIGVATLHVYNAMQRLKDSIQPYGYLC